MKTIKMTLTKIGLLQSPLAIFGHL